MFLASQVVKQAGFANMLLSNKHELGPVQLLLASQQCHVVCMNSSLALLGNLCWDMGGIIIIKKRISKPIITRMALR
jgi:hypothetical protein